MTKITIPEDKLIKIISYWLSHNGEHERDIGRWLEKIKGYPKLSIELQNAIEASKKVDEHFKKALDILNEGSASVDTAVKIDEKRSINDGLKVSQDDHASHVSHDEHYTHESFHLKQIGVIRTPYKDNAPYQPLENDEGTFQVILDPKYADGLDKLELFNYMYVIYLVHKVTRKFSPIVSPSWTAGAKMGIFASRSPVRPNPLGISIVKIKKIEKNVITTNGLDVFDGTPLLDIKPYIKDLDSKEDANYGWIENLNGWEHLILHLKGIPHDY
ncbi:MAG: tRNA (N6-threonylcarbamoyladenosine(37)-N6)-methyltransferase TrmO [Promethearchaeota archaeon]